MFFHPTKHTETGKSKNVYHHRENYFPPFTNQSKENRQTTFPPKYFTLNQTHFSTQNQNRKTETKGAKLNQKIELNMIQNYP